MVLPTLDGLALSAPPRGPAASARQAATWLASRTGRRCPARGPVDSEATVPRFRLPLRMIRLHTPRPVGLWHKALGLAVRTHRAVRRPPADRSLGTAVVPSAVAGPVPARACPPAQDYAGFLRASAGSLFELQALITVARDLQLLDPTQYRDIWSTTQQLERKLTDSAQSPRPERLNPRERAHCTER